MDNTAKEFVPEKDVPVLKAKGHKIQRTQLYEGMEFELAGVKFRIHKFRGAYMTCKPVDWK